MKLSALLFTLLLAGSASAQQVSFRGQVEDVQGTVNQFFVDCTDVSLTSAVVDLNEFVGLSAEITGDWNGSFLSPVVDVTAIDTVVESFEISGNPEVGGELRFGFTGNTGDVGLAWVALESGFFPLGQGGAVQIDLVGATFLAGGAIHPDGTVEFELPLMNDPSIAGLEVHMQGVIVDALTLDFELTNADCKTIEN